MRASELEPHDDGQPFYWNFLEMSFDPAQEDPAIALKVRNLVDEPAAEPRGGGALLTSASQTGRAVQARLPELTTLPEADVHFSTVSGSPLRATRSAADGRVWLPGLVDVQPGTRVLMVAYDGEKVDSQLLTTT